MASESPNASERERLPFEPTQSRKKTAKSDQSSQQKLAEPSEKAAGKANQATGKPKKPEKPSSQPATKSNQAAKPSPGGKSGPQKGSTASSGNSIPEAVSRRMVKRMAIFSGIPTALGMSTFAISYWIVRHGWFKLPNVAVLLVSLGFFGLGVAGLTYGVLSSSWDEEQGGSWLGIGEFTTNWGRMTETWRSQRESRSSKE
ncbi:MAG: PAM68 family protein [Scytolyngbya sp. HA4215-MV1]|jgi:hypothetical protein|nr:PAM68 family protein [Scytolyngbya sp. HA4215-MV1]